MFKFFITFFVIHFIFLSLPSPMALAQSNDEIDLEKELDSGDEEVIEEEAPVAKPEKAVESPSEEAPVEQVPTEQATLRGVDDPDLELEERLFKIFSELKGPITDESWRKIIGKRSKETYRIQKGDTLWDVSRTLFGDPFYWPKVWAVNEDITNPHFVKPGASLNFYQGTVNEEPVIDIKPETPPPPISAPVATGIPSAEQIEAEKLEFLPGEDGDFLPTTGLRAETADQVVIPPPRGKPAVKLKTIPPSIPVWDATAASQPSQGKVFFSGAPPSSPQTIIVPLLAYLAEEFPDDVGEVVEFRDSSLVGSNYQYVYVDVDEGAVGDTFLVVSRLEKPRKFYKILSGVPISVDGEVKLIEKVDDDYFKAAVISNTNPIRVGAKLVKEKLPTVELSTIGPILNVEGQIGGGYLDGLTEFFSPGSFVFLDVGSAQGIKVGGIIYALANEKLRNKKTVDDSNKRDVGLLKIVHTTENSSTAVVVQANDVIMSGDLLGSPGPLNREMLNLSRAKTKTSSILEELSREELLEEERKANSGERKARVKKSTEDEDEDFDLEQEDDEEEEDGEEEE